MSAATQSPNAHPNTHAIELLASDLNHQGGVFCPNPRAHMQVWNSHPKVYLDVAHSGSAKCPYCGHGLCTQSG